MRKLGLALGLAATLVVGLEHIAELATYCAIRLAQAEDLDDLLDVDLDINLDPDGDQAVDQVYPSDGTSERDAP